MGTVDVERLRVLLSLKEAGEFWVSAGRLASVVGASPDGTEQWLVKCESAGLVHSREIAPDQRLYFATSAAANLLSDSNLTAALLEDTDAVRDRTNRGRAFIAHASEDADAIAQPLSEWLHRRGFTVWSAASELVVGQSLRQGIERGLAQSEVGVVILSPAFFAKHWTRRELDALHARLTARSSALIAITHNLAHDDVVQRAPMIANLVSGDSGDGPELLADAIVELATEDEMKARLSRSTSFRQASRTSRFARRQLLDITTDHVFQSTMHVHAPPSARIRWTPIFRLSYRGTGALSILDIVPRGPIQHTQWGADIAFRRVATAARYQRFGSYGMLQRARATPQDNDAPCWENWPITLRAGEAPCVEVEHEYVFMLDGIPRVIESHEEALNIIGPYFHLPNLPDGWGIGSGRLPTKVVCADDEWDTYVAYHFLPVGATVLIGTEEVARAKRDAD
jgi:hypothetical protein